jgi:hypothetical protein
MMDLGWNRRNGVYEAKRSNPGSKPWTAAAGGLLKHLLRLTGSSGRQGNTDTLQVSKSFSAFLAQSGAR